MTPNDKKPETRVTKPVTTGKVDEKSKLEKAIGVFIAEDFDSIQNSIVEDYIKPRAKDFVKDSIRKMKEFMVDNITAAAEIVFFGKKSGTHKTGDYNGTKVNYSYYYSGQNEGSSGYYKPQVAAPANPSSRLKRIIIPEYGKAESVIKELVDLSNRYEVATIADYYQLCGVSPMKDDFNFGWTRGSFPARVEIFHVNGGYVIDLPRPTSVD